MKLKSAKPPKKVYSKPFIIASFFCSLIAFALISTPIIAAPLIGEGYGESKEEARKNALAALSQQILVDVDSTTRAQVTETNGTVDKSAETQIELESHIKFQGVVFEEGKRKKKTYQYSAILSDAALRQTIIFLAERLPEDIDGLTRLQISDAYHEVRQLRALLSYSGQQNLSIAGGGNIAKQAADIESALQLRLGNYGWVRFIPPSSVAFNENFNITIDEKPFATASKIYLPVGSFRYAINAENYASEQGILRVSRGREERVNLSLVRLPENEVDISVIVNASNQKAEQAIMRALEEALLNYKVNIVDDSDLTLVAEADAQPNNAVKGFEHLQVNLSLNFKQSKRTIASSSQNIKLFDVEENEVGNYQWQKLTKQTITELLAGDGLVKVAENK